MRLSYQKLLKAIFNLPGYYMNEKELSALWNQTSEKSLIAMLEHVPDWRPLATKALLERTLSSEGLIRILKVLAHSDEGGRQFEVLVNELTSRLLAYTLTADQIRTVLRLHDSHRLQDEVMCALRRRLLELGATTEEVITLIFDTNPAWREKAVQEFLRRTASFKEWENTLRCWGDERHADVSLVLWKEFRQRFPRISPCDLFKVAQWCPHVQDEVVKYYLGLRPKELANSRDQAHLLYGAAGLVLNKPADGGALWIREDLNDVAQARLCKKAEQFLTHARRLKKRAT